MSLCCSGASRLTTISPWRALPSRLPGGLPGRESPGSLLPVDFHPYKGAEVVTSNHVGRALKVGPRSGRATQCHDRLGYGPISYPGYDLWIADYSTLGMLRVDVGAS